MALTPVTLIGFGSITSIATVALGAVDTTNSIIKLSEIGFSMVSIGLLCIGITKLWMSLEQSRKDTLDIAKSAVVAAEKATAAAEKVNDIYERVGKKD